MSAMCDGETTDQAIIDIIVDAICEGAHDWDAYASPATQAPAERALKRIKEVLGRRLPDNQTAESAPC